jgi:hypothetical protein
MTPGSQQRPDGWEAHRREQLAGNLRSTPLERLRWLEAAIEFAYRAGALPRPDQPTSITPEDTK